MITATLIILGLVVWVVKEEVEDIRKEIDSSYDDYIENCHQINALRTLVSKEKRTLEEHLEKHAIEDKATVKTNGKKITKVQK